MIAGTLSNSKKREIALGVKIILILSSFFICLELILPQYFLWDDNASYFLPCYDYCYQALINEHCIPWMLWNHNFGQTFLTKIAEGFFYPPMYLMVGGSRLLTGDSFWAIDLLAISHLIAGGLGMSLYLKKFNLSDTYRLAGAFLYATTPFGVLLTKKWIVCAYFICMMPWALLSIEKIGKERGILSCFLFIFVQAFFFLNGYVQFWFQGNFLLLLYILLRATYRDDWSLRAAFPKLLGSSMFVIVLISPLILLGLESKNDSFERAIGFTMGDLSSCRVDLAEYISVQFGCFFSNTFTTARGLIYWNGMLVVFGLVVLIPILKNKKMPQKMRLFFIPSLLIVLFSVFLFAVFYWIPPYNTFRFPFRWILFLSSFLVPLFLITIQDITQDRRKLAHGILLFISLWNLSAYLHDEAWRGISKMRIEKRKEIEVSWWDKNYRCVHVGNHWEQVSRANLRAFLLPTLIDRISYFGCDVLLSRRNFDTVCPFSGATIFSMPVQLLENQLATMEKWSGRYLTALSSTENIEAIERLSHVAKIAEEDGVVVYENRNALPLVYFQSNPQIPVKWEIKNNRLVVYPERKEGTIRLQFLAIPNLKITLNNQLAENIPTKQDSIEWVIPPGTDRLEVYYENLTLEKNLKGMGLSWIIFFLLFGFGKYNQSRKTEN